MSFGTLGAPDVEVTDMSTLTLVNIPTFTPDGLGGMACVGDGVNVGVRDVAPAANLIDQYVTYAVLFNVPSGVSNAMLCAADTGVSSSRMHQMKVQGGAGELQTNMLGGSGSVGSEAQVSSNGPYDDAQTYIGIQTIDLGTVGNLTDHVNKMYVGPLDGTLENLLDINGAQIKYWTGLPNMYFCRAQNGANPIPNNGWVGQYRVWQNKFCDFTDAQEIQAEYKAIRDAPVNGNGVRSRSSLIRGVRV